MNFTNKEKLIIFGSLGLALILIIINRKKIGKVMEQAQEKIWDLISEKRIMTLHPKLRDKAREFINKAEKQGIKLRVTSALRTFAEQNDLYAQGRTKAGQIVTQAKGGQSNHNFGLAFDVVPVVNGKATYNYDWNKIGAIGKSVGLSWGGDWKTFKDRPHFELLFGKTTAQLRALYESGNRDGEYVRV